MAEHYVWIAKNTQQNLRSITINIYMDDYIVSWKGGDSNASW